MDSCDVRVLDFESFLNPDSLSPPVTQEERRRRAKEARKLQILQYQQWEQDTQQDGPSARAGRSEGGVKTVSFQVGDRLRDAVMRSDHREGGACSCDAEPVNW